MTRQQVTGTNQPSKSETPLVSGILQRAAVRAVSENEVRSAEEVERSTFRESRFHHDFSRVPIHTVALPIIQTKLTIGALGDSDQQKAPLLSSGVGRAMPKEVQAKMENAFNTNFSNVKIHANSQKASAVDALAYTQGNDIHFAQGKFQPNSQAGQELLGHELTHVVQQRQGRVKPTTQAQGLPVNDDAELEKEAEVKGKKAAQGKFVTQPPNEGAVLSNKDTDRIMLFQKPIQIMGGSGIAQFTKKGKKPKKEQGSSQTDKGEGSSQVDEGWLPAHLIKKPQQKNNERKTNKEKKNEKKIEHEKAQNELLQAVQNHPDAKVVEIIGKIRNQAQAEGLKLSENWQAKLPELAELEKLANEVESAGEGYEKEKKAKELMDYEKTAIEAGEKEIASLKAEQDRLEGINNAYNSYRSTTPPKLLPTTLVDVKQSLPENASVEDHKEALNKAYDSQCKVTRQNWIEYLGIAGANVKNGSPDGTHFTTFNNALRSNDATLQSWRIDKNTVADTCNMLFDAVSTFEQIHATTVVGPDRYHKYWNGNYSTNVGAYDTTELDQEWQRMRTVMTNQVQAAKNVYGRVGANRLGRQISWI